MQSAKINIRKVVDEYIKLCPTEYAAFRKQIKLSRGALIDEDFATAKGTGSGMRALYEIPVTLHDMLVHNLTGEQMLWLKKGGHNGHEGAHWFIESFPVFVSGKVGSWS